MSADRLVTDFCAAWPDMDLDRIMDFFSDDAVYVNIPIDPPNQGKEAVRKAIEGFLGMAEKIEFRVHRQVAGGDVVMNERTDRFLVNGRWAEAPVMGVFEVRDGRIAAWRDYFDMAMFMKEFNPPAGS